MNKTVSIEKRQRGTAGKILIILFWIFNALMALWLFTAMGDIGSIDTHSDAEKAGVAIGAAIGMGALFGIWVLGIIVFGSLAFFTRGKKIIITQEGE